MEDLEAWIKLVACASYDYMKLQQELEERERLESAAEVSFGEPRVILVSLSSRIRRRSVNPLFTSLKITKKNLLSLYLSRLDFCEDFIHHREGVQSG